MRSLVRYGHWLGKLLTGRRTPTSDDIDIGAIRHGDWRRLAPISRDWGFDRGTPIDRHYIEQFLQRCSADVRGHVLEVGDAAYTHRFGGDRVTQSDVVHIHAGSGVTIVADLADAPQIPSASFDCIVFTQTLQLIFDTPAVLATLKRILKPNGVLLATFPGISHNADREWSESWFWNFTTRSARRLFDAEFGPANVAVAAHGNVLAATAFLQGIAVEELSVHELDLQDPAYEVLITVRAVRGGNHAAP